MLIPGNGFSVAFAEYMHAKLNAQPGEIVMSPHATLDDEDDHMALKVVRSQRVVPTANGLRHESFVIYNGELSGACFPVDRLREVTYDDVKNWRCYISYRGQRSLKLLEEGREREAYIDAIKSALLRQSSGRLAPCTSVKPRQLVFVRFGAGPEFPETVHNPQAAFCEERAATRMKTSTRNALRLTTSRSTATT